jgi:small ligand-binding sensory domain FIST
MAPFLSAHAAHPDWQAALALVWAQLEAQIESASAGPSAPTLGFVYLTDHHAGSADALLAELQRRLPGVAWVGSVGVGVCASGVEYFDEPAISVLLAAVPRERFRVYSGSRPLRGFAAHTALVHADPATPDLAELIGDLADRTATGYLFGGLAAARTRTVHLADAVLSGGLSGVAFDRSVAVVSRVTQGCQPIGPVHRITAAQRNVITALDGRPALDVLLAELDAAGMEPRAALPKLRGTLVGLSDPRDAAEAGTARPGAFGTDTLVRHLVGLDPAQRGIAIADVAPEGWQLAFCQRDTEAARRDLMRICAEIREETEPESLSIEAALARQAAGASSGPPGHPGGIAGAIYVSCAGRGGPHFGAPSAELAIVRRALGDVPLAGFFAGGEIARHHLYGYTGVLTVFPAA